MSEIETMTEAEAVKLSGDLTDIYTVALDNWVNERVPANLDNATYAARCSALMIALNRQLARCASAFGEANEVAPEIIRTLVMGQLSKNLRICRALQGAGQAAN